MGEVPGDDQAVGADEGFACGADAGFAVGGEGELRGAGVAAGEGPFGFAVADEEDAGVGHGGGLMVEEEGKEGERGMVGRRDFIGSFVSEVSGELYLYVHVWLCTYDVLGNLGVG